MLSLSETMIDAYLTETAHIRRNTGYDGYGDPSFEVEARRVRWEGRRALVRDSTGNEVVSEAKVFDRMAVSSTDEYIHPDDDPNDPNVKGWPVLSVSEQKGIGGRFSHNEVSL